MYIQIVTSAHRFGILGFFRLAVQLEIDLLERPLFYLLRISLRIYLCRLQLVEDLANISADFIERKLGNVASEQFENLLSEVSECVKSFLGDHTLFQHLELH